MNLSVSWSPRDNLALILYFGLSLQKPDFNHNFFCKTISSSGVSTRSILHKNFPRPADISYTICWERRRIGDYRLSFPWFGSLLSVITIIRWWFLVPFWWLGDAFYTLWCPFDGQVGLLTGFSVLSVMELLYHLGLLAAAISTRRLNVNWYIQRNKLGNFIFKVRE